MHHLFWARRMHVWMQMCACVCVYIHVCMCVYVCICTCTCVHVLFNPYKGDTIIPFYRQENLGSEKLNRWVTLPGVKPRTADPKPHTRSSSHVFSRLFVRLVGKDRESQASLEAGNVAGSRSGPALLGLRREGKDVLRVPRDPSWLPREGAHRRDRGHISGHRK